jgi:hypothetical protein
VPAGAWRRCRGRRPRDTPPPRSSIQPLTTFANSTCALQAGTSLRSCRFAPASAKVSPSTARGLLRMCPLSCPPAPSNGAVEPRLAGIIIRVSGVRVPPRQASPYGSLMANWRKTSTPNVYVAHQRRCAAFADENARCSCSPSWRGRRWNPINHRSEWQKPVTKNRSEVLSWLGSRAKGRSAVVFQVR